MAAHGALVSVMHIIKQIQQHPHPPISLDKEQADSLTENVTFLQNFLERYSSSSSSKEDEELESRIADAAYAAEDVIESHIVDQIHAGSTSHHGEEISSIDFYQGLQKVMQDMDLIKKEVMVITKEKTGAQDQPHRNSSVSIPSIRPASTGQSSTMVGFDDVLNEVMDKLVGQSDKLQIISIVGMGGIGKTTLARNIYANPLIVQHFDILAWVTISQEYSRREILSQVLCQEDKWSMNDLIKMSEDHLGETLRKNLWGRRYLFVMDDIWSMEPWYEIKSFFPDNNNGSRILITTRMSNLASQLSGSLHFQMKFLDEDKSWNLLCEIVFGKEGCPIELENIGKEIAKNCKGLPLSIVVIGGLLTKSNMTRKFWEYTLENLSSIMNLENNEHCLQILRTSYTELPVHLKPCFLYMRVFPEDDEIRVSDLMKMWVAEGFLKPVDGKILEVVAKGYFKELVDRNLILAHKLRWNGEVRLCKVHDLLRDLCLREAQKQRFFCVLRQQDPNIPGGINMERRIYIHENTPKKYFQKALESASLTRSLFLIRGFRDPLPSFSSRLLRVYSSFDTRNGFLLTSLEAIFQHANLRYFSIEADPLSRFPSSWSLFWNLQTLKVVTPIPGHIIAPPEIWKMTQLRHVMFYKLEIAHPPSREDSIVLENLQTLSRIWNLKRSGEVLKRISNIKRLRLLFSKGGREERLLPNFCLDSFCLRNFCHNDLGRLQDLESLNLEICRAAAYSSPPEIWLIQLVHNLTLPHSLTKLSLSGTKLYWDDMTTRIGSLPRLEVLKLRSNSCIGSEWETVEGRFPRLKFLLIESASHLEYWTMMDNTHFPLLEHLVLRRLRCLQEIPSSIGDISMLQSIHLESCSESAADSAKRIKAEQEELGNEGLKVQIGPWLAKKNYDDFWDSEDDE